MLTISTDHFISFILFATQSEYITVMPHSCYSIWCRKSFFSDEHFSLRSCVLNKRFAILAFLAVYLYIRLGHLWTSQHWTCENAQIQNSIGSCIIQVIEAAMISHKKNKKVGSMGVLSCHSTRVCHPGKAEQGACGLWLQENHMLQCRPCKAEGKCLWHCLNAESHHRLAQSWQWQQIWKTLK